MTDPERDPAFDPDDDLRRRRAALDAKLGPAPLDEPKGRSAANSDMARGLKLSSEFIAGVVVGAMLGYLFDRITGWSPFGLIVFLLLGFAAGVLNVLRETGSVAKPEDRMRRPTGVAPRGPSTPPADDADREG